MLSTEPMTEPEQPEPRWVQYSINKYVMRTKLRSCRRLPTKLRPFQNREHRSCNEALTFSCRQFTGKKRVDLVDQWEPSRAEQCIHAIFQIIILSGKQL